MSKNRSSRESCIDVIPAMVEFDHFEERLDEELSSNLPEARDWIEKNCGSHEKLPAVLHLHGQMDFKDWLTLLGETWTSCDNVGANSDELLWVFNHWLDDPLITIPELMTDKEKAVLRSLPEWITIYRGCGPTNRGGLSWSLSRDVAAEFPFMRRYCTEQPLLLTATVSKHRVAALKLDRGEQEVIVVDLPESSWTEEFLTAPPLKG